MQAEWKIFFFRMCFTILVPLFIVFRYFIKGYVVKNPYKTFSDKVAAKLYLNNQKIIDKVIITIFCIIIGYLFYAGLIPLLEDYPLLKENNYNTIIGITTSLDMNATNIVQIRNISIKDLYSDDEFILRTHAVGIEKNEYIVANYLPNSKVGVIIKHQKLE